MSGVTHRVIIHKKKKKCPSVPALTVPCLTRGPLSYTAQSRMVTMVTV